MNIAIKTYSRGSLVLLAFTLISAISYAEEAAAKDKAKALPPAIMKKYDADRDGLLSDSEKAAWKADVQRGRAEAQAKRLEKYDLNQDGKLDKTEKAGAAKSSTKGMATKPSSESPRR